MFCNRMAKNRINKLHEEPLDLYMMIVIPRSRIYSQKMIHLLSIIQIFKHLLEMYKYKHNLLESCLKQNLFV